jgi:hypothetical protein
MPRMLLCAAIGLALSLCWGTHASAQWIKLPKTKNTPFDPGTWNPIPKGKKDNSNVSGFAVMTPAHIADDGRIIGPTSNTAQASKVIGQATLVYEGKQAYWSWTGPTEVGGRSVKELRRRAPQHDQASIGEASSAVVDGNQIVTPSKPQPNPSPVQPPPNQTVSPTPTDSAPKDPWFELGRSIRKVIDAEVQKNQGGE